MAKIVVVHGAGNELWGPASVVARWVPALADGLARQLRIDNGRRLHDPEPYLNNPTTRWCDRGGPRAPLVTWCRDR